MEAKKTVFIDESGNNGFDFSKPEVSTHYIIAAIIIETEKVSSARLQAEKIRKAYFQTGEMKSSYVNDHGRRFRILSDISKIDFTIIAVIIDKKKIYDGSNIQKYKDVFFKYLNKILYLELKVLNTDLAIFADEHGDIEYMQSFSKYIEQVFPRNLLDNNSFEFVNSKKEPLIQVADFIAGTLAYGFEEKKKCQEYKGFYALLKKQMLPLKLWPSPNITDSLFLIEKDRYNKLVAENCIKLARNFMEKNQLSDDEETIDQILILDLFLNEIFFGNPNKYFYIQYLIDYIFEHTGRKYNRHIFQSNIIASMRDSDVIISSSSQGLKVPVTTKELFSYTDQTLGNVLPMLDRLEKARKRVLTITNNELDIIGAEKYKRIRIYIDNYH